MRVIPEAKPEFDIIGFGENFAQMLSAQGFERSEFFRSIPPISALGWVRFWVRSDASGALSTPFQKCGHVFRSRFRNAAKPLVR